MANDPVRLWRSSVELCSGLRGLFECIALLNKMYIPPRYPDAWGGDATPFESYTRRDAVEARECAVKVLEVVKGCVEAFCGSG